MTAAKKTRPQHQASEYGLKPIDSDYDLFRWFLLCYMLGKPIQSSVAVKTWQLFVDRAVDAPWAIAHTPERTLSRMLVEGKYTRYNHVMASALKTMSNQLIEWYEGSLVLMLERSENEDEFWKRLKELYGVGPKTAEIVMRETEEYFARRAE